MPSPTVRASSRQAGGRAGPCRAGWPRSGSRAAQRCLAGLRPGRVWRWVQVVAAFAERPRAPARLQRHGVGRHVMPDTLSIAPPG
jgi:hypothetical protein